MLVLGRKPGQKIRIGEVEVTIVRIEGNRVTIGIDADKSIPIIRAELQEST